MEGMSSVLGPCVSATKQDPGVRHCFIRRAEIVVHPQRQRNGSLNPILLRRRLRIPTNTSFLGFLPFEGVQIIVARHTRPKQPLGTPSLKKYIVAWLSNLHLHLLYPHSWRRSHRLQLTTPLRFSPFPSTPWPNSYSTFSFCHCWTDGDAIAAGGQLDRHFAVLAQWPRWRRGLGRAGEDPWRIIQHDTRRRRLTRRERDVLDTLQQRQASPGQAPVTDTSPPTRPDTLSSNIGHAVTRCHDTLTTARPITRVVPCEASTPTSSPTSPRPRYTLIPGDPKAPATASRAMPQHHTPRAPALRPPSRRRICRTRI